VPRKPWIVIPVGELSDKIDVLLLDGVDIAVMDES